MNGKCFRCGDPCTYTAIVWSDVIEPTAICCECTLVATELIAGQTDHPGPLSIDFLPLLPIAPEELH